jgi:hypothetical protein
VAGAVPRRTRKENILDTVGSEARTNTPLGHPRILDVQFLEVDMNSEGTAGCGACDSARSRLRSALWTAEPVLEELGVEVRVRDVLVETEEQARSLAFRASPTIRVGGIELVPEHRAPEGIPGGAEDGEDRSWLWQGEEHALPPRAMLLDAILQAYAAPEGEAHQTSAFTGSYEVPAYVRRFLAPGATGAGASPRPGAPDEGSSCGCG